MNSTPREREPLRTSDRSWSAGCTGLDDGESVLAADPAEAGRGPRLPIDPRTVDLLMQAPFAVSIVAGPEHRYVLANPSHERMIGRTGVVGKSVREVLPELGPHAPILRMLDEVRATGRPFSSAEFRMPLDVDGDGAPEDHYFGVTCSPVSERGEVVAIQVVAFDVSTLVEDRCRAEEAAQRLEQTVAEREAAEQALRDADRQKDEFLAMLGHELRNPLAALRSATELLERIETSDPLMPRIQQVLERQTGHMARLLDDLLDLARITSGKLAIETSVLDLSEIVLGVVSDLGPDVRQLRFTVDVPPRPLWVHGDRTRLAQVAHNLISNALKYTPPGGTVGVRLAMDHATDREGAVLTVTDSGIGLDLELQPRLFTPFQQAPQDIARSSGGLGLGLAISKTIVELHRGTIAARSEGRDRGSVFEVWLPLAETKPLPADRPAPEGSDRMRVMLVEDNEDAAELFAALLRARGHEARIAARGRDALHVLGSWRPDAVVCDIGLPDIDGYAVARAIRSDPCLADIRLVALSGYGQDEDRRRSAEAGFDAHFTKPTDVGEILQAIRDPGPALADERR